VRSPSQSPYYAKFKVPLNFSKFDLRDYLFHAYNVRTVSIRSAIKQQPVRWTLNPITMMREKLHRPEAEKYMTVEMTQPFVWPEAPKDCKPWGKEAKEHDDELRSLRMEKPTAIAKDRQTTMSAYREQARDLLLGKEVGLSAWEKRRQDKVIKAEEPNFKIKV
jgi:large subunit ribosomal protein L23